LAFLADRPNPFRFAFAFFDKDHPDWRGAAAGVIHGATAAALRPVYLTALAGRKRLNEPVIVDDNQDRSFLAAIKAKFRELGSASQPRCHLVGADRFGGSRPDELLQLADMVCGARLDANRIWHGLIASREL
jgi:hypothetical protein